MNLGINSYTYMWSIGFKGPNPAYPDREARPKEPLTVLGLLHKAHDLGVKLVQTAPNLPLSETELPQFIATAGELVAHRLDALAIAQTAPRSVR